MNATRMEAESAAHERRADPSGGRHGSHGGAGGNYARFILMIMTSMIAMFALTYLTTFRLDDVRWSETRFLMAFVMGAAMAVIMLAYMLSMYRSRTVNGTIVAASVAIFALAAWLVRSQSTVQDASYMRAMIPHHSIAILTSSRAEIADVRVRALADAIIDAQKREIAEMNWLLGDIAAHGAATTPESAAARAVPELTAADYER
jgi:hypothetical protein